MWASKPDGGGAVGEGWICGDATRQSASTALSAAAGQAGVRAGICGFADVSGGWRSVRQSSILTFADSIRKACGLGVQR